MKLYLLGLALQLVLVVNLVSLFLFKLSSQSKLEVKATTTVVLAQVPTPTQTVLDIRVRQKKVISKILTQYKSPMLAHVDEFIKSCSKYQLNCYLLPAIAGVETNYANYKKMPAYNPFGFSPHVFDFESWEESIDVAGRIIRTEYLDRGLITLDDMGKLYASDPTWADKVKRNLEKFTELEAELGM